MLLHGQFVLNGDATDIGGNCFRLTPPAPTSSGSAWYPDKIDLSKNFSIFTRMNFGVLDGSGADGIAFVLQPISTALGGGGGGMGYLGINPSVNIEFDTYQNGSYGDPFTDHVGINSDGNPSHFGGTTLSPPVNILATSVNAEDGAYHDVLIKWDATTFVLSVTVDCSERITYTGNLVTTLFAGDPEVFFGFTAGTGALFNEQTVCFDYLRIGLPPDTITACEGEMVMLQAPSGFSNYNWSPAAALDDPTSATPGLTATVSTQYIVSFEDACGNVLMDTLELAVNPLPVIDLGADTTLCGDATLLLEAPPGTLAVEWSDGTSGPDLLVDAAGIYWLEAGVPGCSAVDSIEVSILDPIVDLGNDTTICAGDSIQIGVPDGGLTYNWNTGQSTSQIYADAAGTYTLTATESVCTASGEIAIAITPLPTVFLPDSLPWCPEELTQLTASGDADLWVWSTSQFESQIEVELPGAYWVTGVNGSCADSDTVEVYESLTCFCNPVFPNAFTPNSDGLNDLFLGYNLEACPFTDAFQLQVFDRNGDMMFSSDDPLRGWDGTRFGKPVELGAYIFVANYQDASGLPVTESGSLTVTR